MNNEIVRHGGRRPANVTLICILYAVLFAMNIRGWFLLFQSGEASHIPNEALLISFVIFTLTVLFIVGIFLGNNIVRIVWLWYESIKIVGMRMSSGAIGIPLTGYTAWLFDLETILWIISLFILNKQNIKEFFLATDVYSEMFNEPEEYELSQFLRDRGYELIPKRKGWEVRGSRGERFRVFSFEEIREYTKTIKPNLDTKEELDEEWTEEKQAELEKQMEKLNAFFDNQIRK